MKEKIKTDLTMPIEGVDPSDIGKESRTSSPSKIPVSAHLVSQLRDGNHPAFTEIFNLYFARVRSFLRTLTKDIDLSEDLTQQVFVDLWLHRQKLDPTRNVGTYIFIMAKNLALRTMRQNMRFENNDFAYNEEVDNTSADDALILKEMQLLVDLRVAAMPPQRKRVYLLSRHENKSNEEIATELKISRKVVEKHLRLAMRELNQVMKGMLSLFLH